MNRIKTLISALLLTGGFCIGFGQEVVEAIVAVVNDEVITLSEYKYQHDMLYQTLRSQLQGEEFQKQYEAARGELLDLMITSILLMQKAREMDIDVTEQLDMYIQSLMQENSLQSEAQLRAAFQQQGVDFDTWKEQTRERFMRDAVVYAEVGRNIVIDDAEILNYYRQHPEEFTQPPEFHISGIFVSKEGRTVEEARRRMEEILSKVEAGEDFGELAAEYSEGFEKDNQGDMGSYREGEMLETFEQEVKKIEEGGITPWIPIESGWYLLRLDERRPSRLLDFEEVRDQIQEKIYTERNQKGMEEYLKELKEKSFIKIKIPDPLQYIDRGTSTAEPLHGPLA